MNFRFKNEKLKYVHIATAFMVVAMFFLYSTSCSRGKKELVDLTFDGDTSYTMKSVGVNSLISDSGIIRYKMTTQLWLIYDEAKDPYWYFPEKVYVEKFDTLFNKEASFQADTAYFYKKSNLWKFIGHVHVENLDNEQFETSLLFYDQNSEKIYSDQFIRITKGDFINTGIGFEANQTLTHYQIFNSGAEIPIQNEAPDSILVENTFPE